MFVYLNDKIVPSKEAVVSVFDHGFLYGDGVYETMRAYKGVIFMLDAHLKRLYRSASMIGLSLPGDFGSIKAAVYETLEANSLRDAYIRVTVSRGYGMLGLDPDLCPEPTFVVIADEMKDYPRAFYEYGLKTMVSKTRRNPKEALNPQIKSLNFLNNILAKIEAKEKGAHEALMLNVKGHLTEGTICNLFFVKGRRLLTPSVQCGILDGITRELVVSIAKREDIEVAEGEFARDDLYGADEVFVTNTTMEVMPVGMVDDVGYGIGETTKLLMKEYKKDVEVYVSDAKASGPSLWGYSE
jgi:branched-chain amino acid aminotransferase